MPEEVKIWEILEKDSLRELEQGRLNLENRIEAWLENDISVLSDDLLVIGRQVTTDYSGRIDLLCIDASGDITVVELKRDMTPRETTAQVLDYAAWVKDLSAEEITSIAEKHLGGEDRFEGTFSEKFGGEMPEILNDNQHMVVVGSEIDDSTARIIGFLSNAYGVGINAVTFNYFRNADGNEILARIFLIEPERAESNTQKAPSKRKSTSRTHNPVVAEVKEVLEGLIEDEAGLKIDSGGNYLRFAVQGWDTSVLRQGGGEWSRSGRILLFEFKNNSNGLELTMYIGPGPQETRQKLFDMASAHPEVFEIPRKLRDKWNRILSHTFLGQEMYEDATASDREREIRGHWREFLEKDLPQIDAILKKERWIWESDDSREAS